MSERQVDRYAVVGNPIGHSKSPRIHTLFAEQSGQAMEYTAILAEPGLFADTARAFFRDGGMGMNVTVPFKNDAFEFSDTLTRRARRAGAVNTLQRKPEGSILGDNTDGEGLTRDLAENHGFAFSGRSILLLGAGGAVQGVLDPILGCAPARVTIANRTASKAVVLAQRFAGEVDVRGLGLDELAGERFDLVINGTAASLEGKVPDIPDSVVDSTSWCYDMMYASEPTAFVRWGQSRGVARSLDGLGMLVEQAAESFYLWRGIRPRTRPVIEALR